MRISSAALLTVLALAAAACTANPRTSATQMSPASAGGAAASPQPANSLPAGDVVNAPRTAPTGTVSTSAPARTY